MKQYTSHDFHPLRLTSITGSEENIISSVEEAAEELLTEWPPDDGDRFYEAVKACLDCIAGKTDPDFARLAFVQAAEEAGMSIK